MIVTHSSIAALQQLELPQASPETPRVSLAERSTHARTIQLAELILKLYYIPINYYERPL